MTGGGRRSPHHRLAASLVAVVVGMVLLTYASVPLYRIFCSVTGFGGTPKTGAAPSTRVVDHSIAVRFNADISTDLPWIFKPGEQEITVKLGENRLTHYVAESQSAVVTHGTATYNVTPPQAGAYFNKIQCFCFNAQTLQPHQKATLPVSFYVDPAILDDPELKHLQTITLSYTFFPVKKSP